MSQDIKESSTESCIKLLVKHICDKNSTDSARKEHKKEIIDLISSHVEENNIQALIKFLIKQAYDQNNSECEREEYKEIVIELILGKYYDDICSMAGTLIYRYKNILKRESSSKLINKVKVKKEANPEDIAHDFIIEKLYEKDTLSNYLNYDYEHILQFLFGVLENYFKSIYNIRRPTSKETKREITVSSLQDGHSIGSQGTILNCVEEKEQLIIYGKKLEELSEKFPLEVKLYSELREKDLIHRKDLSKIYKEKGNNEKKFFYIKKGAIIQIVKEKGSLHYLNILEDYGKDLEKIILAKSKISFRNNENGNILSEEEMVKRAANFLKKRWERFLKILLKINA